MGGGLKPSSLIEVYAYVQQDRKSVVSHLFCNANELVDNISQHFSILPQTFQVHGEVSLGHKDEAVGRDLVD